MAGALKHKTQSPALIGQTAWQEEHLFAGGATGALLTWDATASDKVAWKQAIGLNVATPATAGMIAATLGANNVTGLLIKRFTDTGPTGNFVDFQSAAAASLFAINIAGETMTPLVFGGTAASSTLTLKSTSGVGTTDAIVFVVGNNGATEAVRITTSAKFGIGMTPTIKTQIKGTAANAVAATYNGLFGLESAAQTSFQMGIGSSFNGTWFQSYNQPATSGGVFSLVFNPLGGPVGITTTNTGTWHTSYSTAGILRIGAGVGVWADINVDTLFIGSNYYIASSGVDSYIGTGKAANIYVTGGAMTFRTTNTSGVANGAITWINALTIAATGGLQAGAPTGGDKGAGTLNAVAVYDDNVLLSDAAWDLLYDGRVSREDEPAWGGLTLYSISDTEVFTRQHRHIPTMPGRAEWTASGSKSLGQMVNALWLTVESLQMHIFDLNRRLVSREISE